METKKQLLDRLTNYGKKFLKLDSWQNTLTGLGNIASDKLIAHQPVAVTLLGDNLLEAMYHNDGIANTVVSREPEDAYRQGFSFAGTERSEDIIKELSSLGGIEALQKAATWGRLYGWGAVLIVSDDPGFPSEEIDITKINNLRFEVCDRRDLEPVDEAIRSRASFFKITGSDIKAEDIKTSDYIHESRLIQFHGEPTSARIKAQNKGSDLSVLHRCYDALREYNSDSSSAALMLTDGSMKILKITDFVEMLSSGLTESFKTRLELMDLSMFIGKTLPIDKEEDFQFIERSFAGVSDVITEAKIKLSACTGMPITVLFGVSPAGLNATGESDTRHWYDQVQSAQTNVYSVPTLNLAKTIAGTLGIESEELEIQWNSLWQKTDEEEAEYKKLVAEGDKIYIDLGVLTPAEVREARFGNDVFSDRVPELTADIEAEAEKQRELEMARLNAVKEEPEEEEETSKEQPDDKEEM